MVGPFKSRAQEEQKRYTFAGASLPPPLISYLRLLALAEGTSVQRVLRGIIERHQRANPAEKALNRLVSQAVAEWQRLLGDPAFAGGPSEREAYLEEIKAALNRRKIAPADSTYILQRAEANILPRSHDAADEDDRTETQQAG